MNIDDRLRKAARDAHEAARQVAHTATARESTRPSPLLVVLGTAALVFAVALPVLLLPANPDSGSANDSSPTTVEVPSTTSPTPTAATSVDGWAITEVPQLQTLLEATDDGFVALTGNEVRASADGFVWQEVSNLGVDAWLHDIEHRGDTLVVSGSASFDPESDETPPLAVWTSTDGGTTWNRREFGAVADIVVTPHGFAAVGVERDDSDPDYIKTQGVVWTSPDGLTWTEAVRSNDPEGVSSNFRNVVWDEQLIILGYRGQHLLSEGNLTDDPEPHDNVTWFSDGTTLSEPSLSSLGGSLDPDSTALTEHGLIATTHWGTATVKTQAAAWISQDGLNWRMLDVEPGNYEYTDISQHGGRVFLIGYEIEGDDMSVWSTEDGFSWNRIAVPDAVAREPWLQVEVSESALVVAGNNRLVGVIAGMPRR